MYQQQVDPRQALLTRLSNYLSSMNVEEFVIEQLIITETGTYNNMFSRPFTLDTSPEKLHNLSAMVNEVLPTGAHISASTVATRVPGLIRPSNTPDALVPIANGWNNSRLRFNMLVRVRILGTYRMYVYQGYSDFADFSTSGYIDPRMTFTINSVTVANRTVGPDGRQYDTVIDTYNVMQSDVDSVNLSVANISPVKAMRPSDVFVSSSVQENTLAGTMGGDVVDATGTLGPIPVASDRANNEPTKYVARVVDSYITGQRLSDMGSSLSDVYNNAFNSAAETQLSEDFMLRVLGIVEDMGHHVTNRFSLESLTIMDDTIQSRINLVRQTTRQQAAAGVVMKTNIAEANIEGSHTAGQSEYWDNTSVTTVMATTIANSVNTIMSDLLLTKAAFTLAPGTSETGPVFVPANARSLLNLNLNELMAKFRDRFLMEVYNDITHNGLIGVGLAVNADIFNETWVEITISGQSPVLYVLPTFTDARLSPVITYNQKVYEDTVSDFGVLFDQTNRYS